MKFEIIAISQGQSLNGASVFRSNGEVLTITGTSNDAVKLPLNGCSISLTIKNFSLGISTELSVKSTEGTGDDQINIDTQSPDSIIASCKLVPAEFASLPPTITELYYKLDVISTGLNHPITVLEGNFLSKPDSV